MQLFPIIRQTFSTLGRKYEAREGEWRPAVRVASLVGWYPVSSSVQLQVSARELGRRAALGHRRCGIRWVLSPASF